jgi:hypothetical protein
LREVLGKFIQSQPPETCNKTVEKIATALEELGSVKEAHELRRMFATEHFSGCMPYMRF